MSGSRSQRGGLVALSIVGGAVPTEFRIFAAGVNQSSNGPVLFDDAAAAAVMEAFERGGVDVAIDLEHDSIDEKARAARSDAGDARGWCSLEVRPGPELWACSVSWTPDGERRLCERTQRYISPVVLLSEGNRAAEIFNLALVSQPATFDAVPLVAGRSCKELSKMDPKLVQEALDAVIAGDAKKCADILTRIIAAAAGAEAPEAPEAGAAAGGEALAENPDPKDAPAIDPKPEAAVMAALRRALRVETPVDVLAAVKRLSSEVEALQLGRDADQLNERLDLVGELVKLGAELPATAWDDAEKRIPVDGLRTMPIAALRARVEAFRAAPRDAAARRPAGDADTFALDATEEAAAAKLTPEQRARYTELRRNLRAGRSSQ